MDGRGGSWLQALHLQPREGAGSRQLAQPLWGRDAYPEPEILAKHSRAGNCLPALLGMWPHIRSMRRLAILRPNRAELLASTVRDEHVKQILTQLWCLQAQA